MKAMRYFPLMGFVLLIYNLIAIMDKDPNLSIWNKTFTTITLSPGNVVTFSNSIALITFALIILFFELVKSTTASNSAMIEQLFSMLAFIGFLLQFLLTPHAANPTFFILMVISLVETLAGFVILIKVARRDVKIG
jgi:hypothetical protein